MINPYGCIDQNHAGSVWRLGTSFNPGSEPPKRASRFALSRCISARKASRTNAVLSETPVNASALASKSSSSAMVVRMAISFD